MIVYCDLEEDSAAHEQGSYWYHHAHYTTWRGRAEVWWRDDHAAPNSRLPGGTP